MSIFIILSLSKSNSVGSWILSENYSSSEGYTSFHLTLPLTKDSTYSIV